jgi:hypothetical protein
MEHLDPPTLENVFERQRLYDLLVQRWCLGVDTLDWKLYRSAFADKVQMEFPDPSSPGVISSQLWRAEDWVTVARRLEGFDATQHHLSNFVYHVDGASAEVSAYLVAEHHLGPDHFTLGGRSTYCLERSGEDWKVVKVALAPWWTKGDQVLLAKAGERYASGQAPRSAAAIL